LTPQTAGGLIASTEDRWILAYDDVGLIPGWFAQALSNLVSGRAVAGDPLPPNKAPSPAPSARPVIVSGILDQEAPAELTQVSIGLHLQPIGFDRRRAEGEFWRSFQADHSRILGGLLDVLAEGLALAHAERRRA
jgi:hypothetical protein